MPDIPSQCNADVDMEVDTCSIAERKPKRARILPSRYRDILPEPLLPIIPPANHTSPLPPPFHCPHPSFLRTNLGLCRIFSASQEFTSGNLASHDPEALLSLKECASQTHCRSAFLWSIPKSELLSPRRLVLVRWRSKVSEKLSKAPQYCWGSKLQSGDVQETHWKRIDTRLAEDSFDGEEWEDEDFGWRFAPVTISVPIPRNAVHPGPKDYTIPAFYHRSIISVIREKLNNPKDNARFHYEPFELHWQPPGAISKQEFMRATPCPVENPTGRCIYEAYHHGLVVTCLDGITRRFYPRIFTYSADYPEKILMACIRNLGGCPCPRCLIPLAHVHRLGMTRDREQWKTMPRVDDDQRRANVSGARRAIYESKRTVDGSTVQNILKPKSLVPTLNSFSERLGSFPGFNLFDMFVVDLLHEFELGVWKALFIHLLRILEAINVALINELDRNIELKKMAAHNFEDLLQVSSDLWSGWIPTRSTHIFRLTLLDGAMARAFKASTPYRLHPSTSGQCYHPTGGSIEAFRKQDMLAFSTRELRREAEARKRQKAKKSASKAPQKKASKGDKILKED
ncbi:hypothetical protein Hypma_009968 [Hypsizygus marmoreus]|uniref:Uncharacterized protein n=1 Tax=Hypsizygus marmoreus TaxID=39966 RepID=A0A369JT63_HYPMA|nr:hypothetical protein Hypma_009968 [Hypsizygus marmoreus]